MTILGYPVEVWLGGSSMRLKFATEADSKGQWWAVVKLFDLPHGVEGPDTFRYGPHRTEVEAKLRLEEKLVQLRRHFAGRLSGVL